LPLPDLTQFRAGDREWFASARVIMAAPAVLSGSCMNVTETIRTFLEFFGDRGHQMVPGSSLVAPNGEPVLFTTAGMHPLTRYLEGRPHPQGRPLAGVQRCLRTTDLDEVGDDRHLTVFQMLGSWSLGDYDGPQSLRWCGSPRSLRQQVGSCGATASRHEPVSGGRERRLPMALGGPYGIDARPHEVGLPVNVARRSSTRARPFGMRPTTASHA